MTDQMSAQMPKDLLSKLVASGTSFHWLPNGDVVIVQAHQIPSKIAKAKASALMQMAFQPAADELK